MISISFSSNGFFLSRFWPISLLSRKRTRNTARNKTRTPRFLPKDLHCCLLFKFPATSFFSLLSEMPPKTTSVSSKMTYKDMIKSAIISLKERAGSSRQAVKKYISSHFQIKTATFDSLFNSALRKGVEAGDFSQPKGPSGPIKVVRKENIVAPKSSKIVKKKSSPSASRTKSATTSKPLPSSKVTKTKVAKSKTVPKVVSKPKVSKLKTAEKSKAASKAKASSKTKVSSKTQAVSKTKAPSKRVVKPKLLVKIVPLASTKAKKTSKTTLKVKSASKKAVSNASGKVTKPKAAPKKTTTKKAPVKKAPAKKAPVTKAPLKKVPEKKNAVKKATRTKA